MKLKDLMGKVIVNKRNKQLNVSLKKGTLKKAGLSHKDLLNMDIDMNLKKIMIED